MPSSHPLPIECGSPVPSSIHLAVAAGLTPVAVRAGRETARSDLRVDPAAQRTPVAGRR